ncbi:MAG: DUF541 domain-containing protein [Cyanobacteria bacterium K_Offshore_surface_m2_239]|nr:DUF541 domain-containing protein [Cyanobacteria bacterium K_Offshore_surface_m2_239]
MAVLGLGFITASSVLVKGFRRANDTITVTGASTERIRSDHADWTLEVSHGGSSQEASYVGLQPALETTHTFLRQAGLPPAAIQTGAVRTEKQEIRDPRPSELRGTSWTTRQELRISSADVDRIAASASRIGALIGRGVPLTINEPAYTTSQLASKRVDMLANSTETAGGGTYDTRTIDKDITAVIGVTFRVD